MENGFGVLPTGGHNNRYFGGYEDLAVEMVISERGRRFHLSDYAPDEAYEYARQHGREIETREDLEEVWEEYRLRR